MVPPAMLKLVERMRMRTRTRKMNPNVVCVVKCVASNAKKVAKKCVEESEDFGGNVGLSENCAKLGGRDRTIIFNSY